MTIDWGALVLVTVVTLIAAIFIIGVFSFGVATLTAHQRAGKDGAASRLATVTGYACLVVSGGIAAYGIYLMVPQLHRDLRWEATPCAPPGDHCGSTSGGRVVRSPVGVAPGPLTGHGVQVTASRSGLFDRVFPGVGQFRHYQRSWLRGDVLAGVTVAAYLVPQVMAYADVAGLPPVSGLWAILGPLAVYAVLGSSRQLSIGPESTTALMTAVVLAPLAGADPARYASLAAALAIVVGLICLAGRLARLGFLADLLSRPVLVGYMAGVAVSMIVSQLEKVTGVPVEGSGLVAEIASFAGGLDDVHWPTVALSAGLLALLYLLQWRFPRTPGPLVVVIVGAVLVSVFSLSDAGISVVGEVPAGLPVPAIPDVHWSDLAALLLPAVGIAIVGYTDNVLTGRAFGLRQGQRVDANAEFAALSAANIAAGLLQGFPVSSSGSRTALGEAIGSRSQLYSLITLACVVLTLLLAGPLLASFPSAALGALVIYAAVRLIEVAEIRRIGHFRRSELLLAVGTTVAVLLLGVLYGVLVAVALSIVDLVRRVARPHDGILGYVPGLAGMHDVDGYENARQIPAGLIASIGADRVFPTLPTAVIAFLTDYRERHGSLPPGVRMPIPPADPLEAHG